MWNYYPPTTPQPSRSKVLFSLETLQEVEDTMSWLSRRDRGIYEIHPGDLFPPIFDNINAFNRGLGVGTKQFDVKVDYEVEPGYPHRFTPRRDKPRAPGQFTFKSMLFHMAPHAFGYSVSHVSRRYLGGGDPHSLRHQAMRERSEDHRYERQRYEPAV